MEKGQRTALGIAGGLAAVIVALAIYRAESTWAVAVATIGLVFATLVLGRHSSELNQVTKALTNATERMTKATERMALLAERAQVLDDIRMYQDIAEGNRWEYGPGGGDVGTSDHDKWDMWRQRCIEYRPRILDPQLKSLYDEFIPMLKGQKTRDRWTVVFADVKLEAQRQISPLQGRLKRVNELLAQERK